MADWTDITLRLLVATATGARLRTVPAGPRENGLPHAEPCRAGELHRRPVDRPQRPAADERDAAGRVIQGVLSGVGFIGAGAVLHGAGGRQVQGLATAASIWVSAALSAAAALAIWPLIVIGVGVALIVLFVGAPIERRIRDHARDTPAEQDRIDMERRP